MVPLGLASNITFDGTSARKSQCHTNGGDSEKVVKMQPPAPFATASQCPAIEGSVLTSSQTCVGLEAVSFKMAASPSMAMCTSNFFPGQCGPSVLIVPCLGA
eukprot:2906995-Ditylum_brightwellii.AAC.1